MKFVMNPIRLDCESENRNWRNSQPPEIHNLQTDAKVQVLYLLGVFFFKKIYSHDLNPVYMLVRVIATGYFFLSWLSFLITLLDFNRYRILSKLIRDYRRDFH